MSIKTKICIFLFSLNQLRPKLHSKFCGHNLETRESPNLQKYPIHFRSWWNFISVLVHLKSGCKLCPSEVFVPFAYNSSLILQEDRKHFSSSSRNVAHTNEPICNWEREEAHQWPKMGEEEVVKKWPFRIGYDVRPFVKISIAMSEWLLAGKKTGEARSSVPWGGSKEKQTFPFVRSSSSSHTTCASLQKNQTNFSSSSWWQEEDCRFGGNLLKCSMTFTLVLMPIWVTFWPVAVSYVLFCHRPCALAVGNTPEMEYRSFIT